jgi:mannose-6-phosphate isomerase-like protein (cupin superfamily)
MRANQTIGNRITGETLTMLVSEEDNDGTLQIYRVVLPPYRAGPPLHYHTAFRETFAVEEGTLDIYVGRKRTHIVLRPGDRATAQIGQPHTFANHSGERTVIRVETKPAGGVVRAFQLAYAVANEGRASEDGLPRNPLLRLRFIQISQGFLPGIPLWLQKAAFGMAALLSRITGVETRVRRYLAAPENQEPPEPEGWEALLGQRKT